MSMNRTEGYIKAFVDVSYINNQGDKIHMMSFQLATGKMSDQAAYDRVTQTKTRCELDNSQMQTYIRQAIASVQANDYQVILDFGLSC